MKKTIIVAAALAAVAAASPAAAQNSAVSADPRATAGARLIKPLTLKANRGLNFGTIIMGAISSDQVVSIDGAGAVTCGVSGLTCTNTASATATSASYSVTGTQGQVVLISTAPTPLTTTNGTGGTLTLTPKAPDKLTLGNSGAAANDFTVGGSITISSTTQDGVYAGEVDVQVAYQ